MSAPTDDQIKEAIDAVFAKYDKDGSGALDKTEVTALINDALAHMGANRKVTPEEVQGFMKAVDVDNSGTVTKPELFKIFKQVLAK